MTLDEISANLTNGFHDAEIRSILADYGKRRVTILLDIWLGEGPDSKHVPQEAYRLAEVVVEGLHFLAMDPPRPESRFAKGNSLMIDLDWRPEALSLPILKELPKDCFASRFYVDDWLAFIYIAARSASFSWKGELYDRAALKP